MIQRVQTIFMAIGAIVMFAVMFSPIWWKQSLAEGTNELVLLDALRMVHLQGETQLAKVHTFYIAILSFISSVLFIGSIFSFKNRFRQVQLNLLNTLIMIGAFGISTYFIWMKGIGYFDPQNQGSFAIGYYLPIVALFANMLANRFIRRDERLVKSVDRIR